MIVALAGKLDKSKLTKPRVTRYTLRPALISSPSFPPPLLDLNPSNDAVAERVIVLITGVGVGVGVGFLVGVSVVVGDCEFGEGIGVKVGEGETF